MTSKKKEKDNRQIITIPKREAPLTREQLTFNKLSSRISYLQEKIKTEAERLDIIRGVFRTSLFPEIKEVALQKIRFARLLDQKCQGVKLSKTQAYKFNLLIIQFLDDAFYLVAPTEETQALYDKYTDFDDEALTDKERLFNEQVMEAFQTMFAPPPDAADADVGDDHGKNADRLANNRDGNASSAKPRPKTQKQLEKEEMEKKKEALKNQSLRRIYHTLAKILHPDTEPDAELRTQKEEFMKQATVAYNEKNLLELLRLEMDWVKTQGSQLSELGTDTLKIYLQLMKDQVKELEMELHIVHNDAAQSEIAPWVHMDKTVAARTIEREAVGVKSSVERISKDMAKLGSSTKVKADLLDVIKIYYEEEEEDMMW